MFLGCKAEETSRWLSDVIIVAYKLVYKWDPSAPQRIKQKEVYDKHKELILNGERFLLAAFDLNIEHPYKPLVGALKRLEISDKELTKVAWNFVNDWLHTTLCLQYKPHYIAAGSIFLAAKIRKVKLPKEKGKVWWMQFDVSPKHLEEVVQQMVGLLEHNRKQAQPLMHGKVTAPKPIAGAVLSGSPHSCTPSGSVARVCGILTGKVNAEGLVDSLSSKCDEKQVCSDVQDTLEPIAGRELSCSPQSGIPSSSVVAPDFGILPSMTKAEGLCDSLSSKCNDPRDCTDVQDTLKETRLHCQTSDSGSAGSIVEDCEGDEPVREKSDLNLSCKIVSIEGSCKIVSIEGSHAKIDVNRIIDTFRKRRRDRIADRKLVEDTDDEMDSEAWIEGELENGIKVESDNADKRRRL